MYRNLKSAFTLIEILVVIAIIGLLAAILFPVFGRVRENARRSSCQSRLMQLGLGIMQYVQDYDERYPTGQHIYPSASGGDNKPKGHGWVGPTYPYVKSRQVFVCPADTTPTNSRIVISYAYNQNIANDGNSASSRLLSPAKTVMLFEVLGAHIINVNPDEGITSGTTTNGSPVSPAGVGNSYVVQSCTYGCNGSQDFGVTPNILKGASYATGLMANRADPNSCYFASCFVEDTGRHLETSNFLMADGHVKAYRGEQVSTGGSASSSASAQGGNAAGTADNTRQVTFSVK